MAPKRPVSNDFARGFQAAYDLVRHVETSAGSPFKSIIGVTTNSPTEALECFAREMFVPEPEAASE